MHLQINKQVEVIDVRDGEGNVALSWEVPTDDASIARMTSMLASAIDRAAALSASIDGAGSPEEQAEPREQLCTLQRRVITSVLGEVAYGQLLEYMGDGEPVDPMENICNLGEVFAALCVWVHDHCTNAQLREAAEHLGAEATAGDRGRKGRKRK